MHGTKKCKNPRKDLFMDEIGTDCTTVLLYGMQALRLMIKSK
jgi:hypothetical protein